MMGLYLLGIVWVGLIFLLSCADVYKRRRVARAHALTGPPRRQELLEGRFSVRDVELNPELTWTYDEATNQFWIIESGGKSYAVDLGALAVLKAQTSHAHLRWAEEGFGGLDLEAARRIFAAFGSLALGIRRTFQVGPEDGEPELILTVVVPDGTPLRSLRETLYGVRLEMADTTTRHEMFSWFYRNAPGLEIEVREHADAWVEPEAERRESDGGFYQLQWMWTREDVAESGDGHDQED